MCHVHPVSIDVDHTCIWENVKPKGQGICSEWALPTPWNRQVGWRSIAQIVPVTEIRNRTRRWQQVAGDVIRCHPAHSGILDQVIHGLRLCPGTSTLRNQPLVDSTEK